MTTLFSCDNLLCGKTESDKVRETQHIKPILRTRSVCRHLCEDSHLNALTADYSLLFLSVVDTFCLARSQSRWKRWPKINSSLEFKVKSCTEAFLFDGSIFKNNLSIFHVLLISCTCRSSLLKESDSWFVVICALSVCWIIPLYICCLLSYPLLSLAPFPLF